MRAEHRGAVYGVCAEAKNDKVKETFVYLYEREKCLFGVIRYGQQLLRIGIIETSLLRS